MKNKRKLLVSSFIMIITCCLLFAGTTFAWFSDSVSSNNNIIVAGNLDVELEYSTNGSDWKTVNKDTYLIDQTVLWEPGHTEAVLLKVVNKGTLALKYSLSIDAEDTVISVNREDEELKLSKYLEVGHVITRDEKHDFLTNRNIAMELASINNGFGAINQSAKLLPNAYDYVQLAICMPTTVGNEANHKAGAAAPQVSFKLNLVATQVNHEEDSFGDSYDSGAPWLGGVDTTWYDESKTEYVIKTPEQLAGFAAIVNGSGELSDTFAGKTVYLGANIDLNNLNWTPIGCPNSDGYVGFAGTFDGKGHTISNLNVNHPEAWGQGLFGYIVAKPTIKNFTINDVNINAEDTSGAVAGYATFGTFENLHVTGDVTIVGAQHMGGVVGNGYYANFKNCSVIAEEGSYVTATTHSFVGGIVGYHGGNNLVIENSTVKNLTITAYGAIGAISGIVGQGGKITGCLVENVVLNKTSVETYPSIGLATGNWLVSDKTVISNNTFRNITLNGKHNAYPVFDIIYGSEYDGSTDQFAATVENNVCENIDNNLKVLVKEITVTTKEELVEVLANVNGEVVINATGVTYTISTADYFVIPGGVTIKGLTINNTYRGISYVMFGGKSEDKVVFENCSFGNTNRIIALGGMENGASNVVYNNCTFKGQVLSNYVDNLDGVAEFNNCTFTKSNSGSYHYIETMGGTHNFNNCTFDYTGVSQTSMGVITSGQINVYSEAEYWTIATLTGCTRTNCGTRKYGPNSTLNIK